jgi:hypothetical protein
MAVYSNNFSVAINKVSHPATLANIQPFRMTPSSGETRELISKKKKLLIYVLIIQNLI